MKENDDPIIVEQEFNLPASIIWEAITNVSEMRHWFFNNIPDFKPMVGFDTEFIVYTGERNFLHQWKILEVEPLKKIVYDWTYAEYKGRGIVTFEIVNEAHKVKLKVISEGMHSFPQNIPEFKRESCVGGWNYFIKQSLKKYLDNK